MTEGTPERGRACFDPQRARILDAAQQYCHSKRAIAAARIRARRHGKDAASARVRVSPGLRAKAVESYMPESGGLSSRRMRSPESQGCAAERARPDRSRLQRCVQVCSISQEAHRSRNVLAHGDRKPDDFACVLVCMEREWSGAVGCCVRLRMGEA